MPINLTIRALSRMEILLILPLPLPTQVTCPAAQLTRTPLVLWLCNIRMRMAGHIPEQASGIEALMDLVRVSITITMDTDLLPQYPLYQLTGTAL